MMKNESFVRLLDPQVKVKKRRESMAKMWIREVKFAQAKIMLACAKLMKTRPWHSALLACATVTLAYANKALACANLALACAETGRACTSDLDLALACAKGERRQA
ncbi:hypothetical protein QL285_029322 [Trifolium repens]|nr:hypothetical protein QL285_029322 [Trifolium repens]